MLLIIIIIFMYVYIWCMYMYFSGLHFLFITFTLNFIIIIRLHVLSCCFCCFCCFCCSLHWCSCARHYVHYCHFHIFFVCLLFFVNVTESISNTAAVTAATKQNQSENCNQWITGWWTLRRFWQVHIYHGVIVYYHAIISSCFSSRKIMLPSSYP